MEEDDEPTLLRPTLRPLVDALARAHPDGMTLDELADELATKSISFADVEAIIDSLEAAGVSLDGDAPAAPRHDLVRVLAAARALAAESGRSPSPDELATRTGMTVLAVRRALLLGRALGAS